MILLILKHIKKRFFYFHKILSKKIDVHFKINYILAFATA